MMVFPFGEQIERHDELVPEYEFVVSFYVVLLAAAGPFVNGPYRSSLFAS